MKTYETPTEMAVRLNHLQEQVEQLEGRVHALEHELEDALDRINKIEFVL